MDVVRLVATATSASVVRTCDIVTPPSMLTTVVTTCRVALDVNADTTIVGVAVVEGVDCGEVTVELGTIGVGAVEVGVGAGLGDAELVTELLEIDVEAGGVEEVDGGVDVAAEVVGLGDEPVPDGADCRLCKASSILSANATGKRTSARRIKRIDINERYMFACRGNV